MKKIIVLLLPLSILISCSKKSNPTPQPKLVPSIINFTPTSGVTGTEVTISGTNFSTVLSNNLIKINGIAAIATYATTSQVKINTPAGATSGKITIQVNGEIASSGDNFTVIQGSWNKKANFGGNGRVRAVGFSIGSKGYVFTGYTIPSGLRETDFWEYDTITNVWTKKADFPGDGRELAVGFSIGNKGYMGLGYSLTSPDPSGEHKDLWEYNASSDQWTQKGDVPFAAREAAIGFSIGDKGYVGLGTNESYSNNYHDFWEYDPATDSWVQKTNFPGTGLFSAVGFSINDKGYVGSGGAVSLNASKQFWQYDPSGNTWTQKADFGGEARTFATGFAINNKGYMGFGYSDKALNDFWSYDPSTDSWTRQADFTGSSRYNLVSFSIGSDGYIGTGNPDGFKDFWQFIP